MEVKEVFSRVKPNKATGWDLVPPLVVYQSADVFCYPFCTLINHIITKGPIPQQRKLGQITPFHWKDCPWKIRPQTNVNSTLTIRGFWDINPFANKPRKHLGYHIALLTLTERWKKELDNHKTIGHVSMDLSRAFDSLPHVLIVSKLRQYGADERTPSLIKDYLSNCHQRVKLGIETQPGK